MSRQKCMENRGNKWNRRMLRLAAAAFVVMLLGQMAQPGGEQFSVAGNVRPGTITLVPEEERGAAGYAVKGSGAEAEQPEEAVQGTGHGTWESIEAYYKDSYTEGNSRAFYADLTHNGCDDLIVLETQGDASAYTLEAMVTVFTRDRSGEIRTVYERQIDQSHAGWGWLYLYEENGKSYLMEYDPVLYEGPSRYAFSVFYFSEEGERIRLAGDALEFEWNGETGKGLEDQIKAFHQKAFAYMEHSQVIAAVGEEYFSNLQMCALGE